MEVTRMKTIFGIDISNIDHVYAGVEYGRSFIIHPYVISQNGGKFEFPVYNCDVIEMSGKMVIIVPGNKTMRVFEVDDESEIEDVYKSPHIMYYDVFNREKWKEKTKAVIIVTPPNYEKNPIVEWKDGAGNRWMSTIDCETGEIETIPNPNPPPPADEEDD